MTTKLYDELSLRGQSISLPYGDYSFALLAPLTNILSLSLAPFTRIKLYTRDNQTGRHHTLVNLDNKALKIAGFYKEFDFPIRSITIECSCKTNNIGDPTVKYTITKSSFTRGSQREIAYTFYYVHKESRQYPILINDNFENPMAMIIPDFGQSREELECFQKKLAKKRVSSLIVDTRGLGQSYSSTSVTYGDIIQDYKFIGNFLGIFRKPPILLGCGYGGAIAQLWALTYKFELSYLILIGSAPYSVYRAYNTNDASMIQWSTNLIPASTLATTVANSAYNMPSEEADVNELKQSLQESIQTPNQSTLKLYYTQNPDNILLANTPQFIQTPTLLIHGLNDAYIPISGSNTLYSLIPNVKYRKINAGHSPHLTNPSRTIQLIFDVLSPNGSIYFELRPCPLKKCKPNYSIYQ